MQTGYTVRRAALACALLVSSTGCRDRSVEAGFWFEPVTFESSRLGGAITPQELQVIESIARSELVGAFKGLAIRVSDRRSARYHVRVVQELWDPRFVRPVGDAGQSRAIAPFGGAGAVNFAFLAGGAVAYAPPAADRAAIIMAIGRGIGRTAVHEFTHQLLPLTPIHDSTNVHSYEHASAARPEHYYGTVEWDLAWPLLQERFAPPAMIRRGTSP